MEPILLTENRLEEILPQNIKDTDVISENAKKVLASIMNYYLALDKVKQQGYVHLSNEMLRQSARIKQTYLMTAIQELIDYNLIEREAGKRWTKGQPHVASKYTVIWNNLIKPLKKKTFEDLFSDFLKPSETPMGTIVLDIDTVIETGSDIVSDIESETVEENVLEKNKRIYDISCDILEDSSKKQIEIQDKEYNEWIEDNLKYNVIEKDITYI